MMMRLDELVQQVASGRLHIQIGKRFRFDEIVEAWDRVSARPTCGRGRSASLP